MKYRELKQTGKCNCCGKGIERLDKKVITFHNQCNNYGLIKICDNCLVHFSMLTEE